MDSIEISNISYSYGDIFSLKNISMNVGEGKIFALLGPNGAGKTTLVKIMLDLITPNSGQVSLNGVDSRLADSRYGIAFIPEKFSFFPYYTVRGVLEFFGSMKGIKKEELQKQIDIALEELGIQELQNRTLKTLSKGQVQRTGLASLLIGENKLLILDEPFSGLDPIGMMELKTILKKLKNQGKTIFLNSHILSEMEQICDDIAILNKGELLFMGSVQQVRDKGKNLEEFFYHLIKSNSSESSGAN